MRPLDAWSQDVVLSALCDSLRSVKQGDPQLDFILLTGDIAFSGDQSEYALAAEFLKELVAATAVPLERIFCIPGNHDIQRDRQRLAFFGARSSLLDQNRIDEVLSPNDSLATLVQRQEEFRRFQASSFGAQVRMRTPDDLAYVSRLFVEDVRIAIVGLDSAWVADGDVGDHGRLVIGERQVRNALELALSGEEPPDLVIAMAHHPCHLLHEADRSRVQTQIEKDCHFFHCGHLHEAERRAIGQGASGCLTLGAGASFTTRHAYNSCYVVTVDLLTASRTVTTLEYQPATTTFTEADRAVYQIELAPSSRCTLAELAEAIIVRYPRATRWAYYLASLVLEQKSEVPVVTGSTYAFATLAIAQAQSDSSLKVASDHLVAFKNAVRLLYGRATLDDILGRYGGVLDQFVAIFEEISSEALTVGRQLEDRDSDARALANAVPTATHSHATELFRTLVTERDWELLKQQAERHIASGDTRTAALALRALALARAHSADAQEREQAMESYRGLIADTGAMPSDFADFATILINGGDTAQATDVMIAALERFGPATHDLLTVGERVVAATGNRDLRRRLNQSRDDRAKLP